MKMKYIKNFLLMLQFLTRIPINLSLPCEKEDFGRGAAFLPLVGLIIGAFQWCIYYLLIKILPINITAIFVVVSGLLITGGLHLDGFGDTCDGFFAFKGKDKIIEIMKDSRIGTYACIAIVSDVIIRSLSIEFLLQNNFSYAIIAAPVVSRFTTVMLCFIGKAAKEKGTGNFFIGNINKKTFITALILAIIPVCFFLGIKLGIIAIISSVIFSMMFNIYCLTKINGHTGDTLGANNELIEMVVLILCCVFLKVFIG